MHLCLGFTSVKDQLILNIHLGFGATNAVMQMFVLGVFTDDAYLPKPILHISKTQLNSK